jgi:hypothetical protein
VPQVTCSTRIRDRPRSVNGQYLGTNPVDGRKGRSAECGLPGQFGVEAIGEVDHLVVHFTTASPSEPHQEMVNYVTLDTTGVIGQSGADKVAKAISNSA